MPATDSEDADARLQQIAKDAKPPTAASPSSYLGLNNDAVSPRNTSKCMFMSGIAFEYTLLPSEKHA